MLCEYLKGVVFFHMIDYLAEPSLLTISEEERLEMQTFIEDVAGEFNNHEIK